MLNNIYQAVKNRLNPIGKPVEWYNVQYEGTMINEDGFFVEFTEPLRVDSVSKQLRRAPVKLRLHVYSKAMQTHDGITDDVIQQHEATAMQALALLDGFTPDNKACSRLTFTAWQHWHRWKGWMVTLIDFEAKKEL